MATTIAAERATLAEVDMRVIWDVAIPMDDGIELRASPGHSGFERSTHEEYAHPRREQPSRAELAALLAEPPAIRYSDAGSRR